MRVLYEFYRRSEPAAPLAYLAALLEAEMAERAERRERRRLIDARFPALKRLEDFRFADDPRSRRPRSRRWPRAPGSTTASPSS
jgi:DNA replication protein DnaC